MTVRALFSVFVGPNAPGDNGVSGVSRIDLVSIVRQMLRSPTCRRTTPLGLEPGYDFPTLKHRVRAALGYYEVCGLCRA